MGISKTASARALIDPQKKRPKPFSKFETPFPILFELCEKNLFKSKSLRPHTSLILLDSNISFI